MSYRIYKDKLLGSTCWIYVLQSLQGQTVGIHIFILNLDMFKESVFFIVLGISCQIYCARYEMVSVP